MDLRVGQTGFQNAYAAQPTRARLVPDPQPAPERFLGSADDGQTAADALLKRQNRDIPKVGFGNDTVSVPGATVRTVGRNLGAGRQIIQSTVEEPRTRQTLQTQGRKTDTSTARQDRAAAAEANAKQPAVAIPRASAAAAGQARGLVNSVNKAAGEAQARVQGETPQATSAGINIRVGDQTVAVKRTEVPQFDIRA